MKVSGTGTYVPIWEKGASRSRVLRVVLARADKST
jgi:hypothetical protein